MAPGILNKLRRRQSASLPLRTQHAHSYVHHASTPPDWPTKPSQATPDVYITSPPEDDGLQRSVCVHRAVEHEPKRLRKHEDHPPVVPVVAPNANEGEVEGPPAFRRPSLQAPDVVLPKKPSELGRESPAKWAQILDRQPATDKGAQEQAESAVMSGVDLPAAGHVQWEGGHQLARVSSSRDLPAGAVALAAPKPKATLRRRASKVFKSLTNRESLTFSSDKRPSQTESRTGQPQKRRNTLSDSSRPFSIWAKAATTATAHAIPVTAVDDSAVTPPAKASVEGRRRSSTISHVERIPRPTSPPLPSPPISQEAAAKAVHPDPNSRRAADDAVLPLEAPLEIVEPASKPTSDATSKSEKSRKLQSKRSKNTFSHLFNLKGEKLRSPPPAKQDDAPVPPVPVIPQELAKAVADPETPEVDQSPTFTSPVSTVATPKSGKSKRFKRHRRRATISSMSQSQISTDVTGTPSSMSTVPQADTPKTPTSLRSGPFSIIDLRKGFSMRSLGKGKGKLFSAKSSPASGSPAPPVPKLPGEHELPATVMQRYKMSRPPPLQSSDLPQSDGAPVPASASTMVSSTTVEFDEAVGTPLPSPTESEGPVTPMFGVDAGSAPALSLGLALAPAIQLGESKQSESGTPELPSPPTSDESGHGSQASAASEATIVAEDPMFGAFDMASSIGDLQLQLQEPSTKTSTLDVHLRLDSLRFDNFSFDTDGF